jgi:hypothetical protein
MSDHSSDPDQDLRDLIARDRAEKQTRDAQAAEERRKDRDRQRIPQAVAALRRSAPLDDRSADAVWLDLLARLLDALTCAGKAGLLDKLPDRGTARRYTRRCIDLLKTGRREQALVMLKSIGPGELDAALANERNAELPDDLCRLLDLPIPQPAPAPVETVLPTPPGPACRPTTETAGAPERKAEERHAASETGSEDRPRQLLADDGPLQMDKITKAIALKQKHRDWTGKRIADAVGCTPANLSQSPRWKVVAEAIREVGRQEASREGRDHRGKDRGGTHRGRDMSQYADHDENRPSTRPANGPKCASCGDPAGTDAEGAPLIYDGMPRCPECWKELADREAT